MMQLQNSKKTAYLGLMVALALIFSYVETLIPFDFGIPGVKIGLANIVSLIAIYLFGAGYAVCIVTLRVIISGFLFGNLYSIIYSLAGGLISIGIMLLLKKTSIFSLIGISVAGGVFHNIGQLIVAIFTVSQIRIVYYGPLLIISGIIMGGIIGFICVPVLKRVETYVR